jgi:hypothetical protein
VCATQQIRSPIGIHKLYSTDNSAEYVRVEVGGEEGEGSGGEIDARRMKARRKGVVEKFY